MMSRPRSSAAVLLLIVSVFLGVAFSDVLRAPFDIFLGGKGDAIKNYYTPWYHVAHDSSWHWFEGMNYPYGDHIVFADAQPTLTNTLKALAPLTGNPGAAVPGIMNLLMLLSIMLAAWWMWLILRRMKIPDLPAAVFAALIALLSPQIFRMNGHYALAYSCMVPLTWYLVMRFRAQRSWTNSLLLTGSAVFWSGFHPYYLMLYALFAGLVWAFDLLLPAGGGTWRRRLARHWPHLFVQLLLPFILFKLYLVLTDPVTDRPAHPYGFTAYTSSWKSVFFPQLYPWIASARKAIGFSPVHVEGWGYVGLCASVAFGAGLGFVISRLRKKEWKRALMPFPQREMNIYLLTGLFVFLFASGYLFPGPIGEWIGGLPGLSQFRSTGRFVWIFYFVWTAIAWKLIWEWHRKLSGRWPRIVIALAVLLLAVEAAYSLHLLRKHHIHSVSRSASVAKAEAMVPKGFSVDAYDALLVTPWYHLGSENFASGSPDAHMSELLLSVNTGTPLMNASLSRTSFDQTWKLTQFPLAPLERQEILADLAPETRILNLQHKKARKKQRGIAWLQPSDSLFRRGPWTGYDIRLPSLPTPEAWQAAHVPPNTTDSAQQATYPKPFFQADADLARIDFANVKHRFDFAEVPPPGVEVTAVDLSMWVRLRRDQLPVARLRAMQFDDNAVRITYHTYNVQSHVRAMAGEWALIDLRIPEIKGAHSILLQWEAFGDWREYLSLRKLMMFAENDCLSCRIMYQFAVFRDVQP